MKLIVHMLITLLALAPAIPTYAMDTAGGKASMDTEEGNGARRGIKRKREAATVAKAVTTKKAKKLKCSEPGCNKKFDKKSLLIRHARIHTGEKPYKCKYCNRGFNQKSSMESHVRIHTGEKPFACPYQGCGRKFIHKIHLTHHIKKHTGKKPYSRDNEGDITNDDLDTLLKLEEEDDDAYESSDSMSLSTPASQFAPAPPISSIAIAQQAPSLSETYTPLAVSCEDHTHSGFATQAEPTHAALPPIPHGLMYEPYNPEAESLFSLPMPDDCNKEE